MIRGVVALGESLAIGFRALATPGTATALAELGIAVEEVPKVGEGKPDVVDRIEAGDVALVFGTEMSGLSNAELARCGIVATIPANADYASLNLAAAVQVVAYELRLAHLAAAPRVR